jgi:hypothetical protein
MWSEHKLARMAQLLFELRLRAPSPQEAAAKVRDIDLGQRIRGPIHQFQIEKVEPETGDDAGLAPR